MRNKEEILNYINNKKYTDYGYEDLHRYLDLKEWMLIKEYVEIKSTYESDKYLEWSAYYNLFKHTKEITIEINDLERYVHIEEKYKEVNNNWFSYKETPEFNIWCFAKGEIIPLFELTRKLKNNFYICNFKNKKYIVKSDYKFTEKLPPSKAYDDCRCYDAPVNYVSWKVKFIKMIDEKEIKVIKELF